MSEYQYFEFRAIDRPLNAREVAALRTHSTRARITPTSFVNEYHWGDFKGDPDAWMAYSLLVRAIRLADREVALTESMP